MSEKEKPERPYPLKSLHDFLSELDREWSKFRTGTLISIIASGALLVFFVPRSLQSILKASKLPRPPIISTILDIILLVLIAAFLLYSIHAMITQYRFFSKWERRIGLLLHLEEKLIGEKLEEKSSG